MKIINRQLAHRQQGGIVLLTLIIVIALTLSTYYFLSISLVDIDVENREKTRKVLAEAKQALIDYAVINWTKTGEGGKLAKLPCVQATAINPEGKQDPKCGTAYNNAIGYFPWGTLGTGVLKDQSGSCLLYAVSPAYKISPAAALNPDSYGQFQIIDSKSGVIIQGATPEDRPVAVIFAPNSAMGAQTRNHDLATLCGKDYGNISAYLDNDGTINNASINSADNQLDQFVQSYIGSDKNANPLNDMLVTITHDEIWAALDSTIRNSAFNTRMENLTEAIALCFLEYGLNNGRRLPMPAALDLNGGEYRWSADYEDGSDFTTAYSGRLPYDVSSANTRLANSDESKIFSNNYCTAIDLVIGTATNINFKDASGNDKGVYYDLWSNWKDHFFYAISKNNRPVSPSGMPPVPAFAPLCSMSSDCIQVAGKEYAGIIFFSGLKQDAQKRYAPPFEADTKSDVFNYLEGNAAFFPDNDGDHEYISASPPGSNDVMFCIKDDMSGVVKC